MTIINGILILILMVILPIFAASYFCNGWRIRDYTYYEGNYFVRKMKNRKNVLKSLQAECPATIVVQGCPKCKGNMRDDSRCEWFKCVKCHHTISYSPLD